MRSRGICSWKGQVESDEESAEATETHSEVLSECCDDLHLGREFEEGVPLNGRGHGNRVTLVGHMVRFQLSEVAIEKLNLRLDRWRRWSPSGFTGSNKELTSHIRLLSLGVRLQLLFQGTALLPVEVHCLFARIDSFQVRAVFFGLGRRSLWNDQR